MHPEGSAFIFARRHPERSEGSLLHFSAYFAALRYVVSLHATNAKCKIASDAKTAVSVRKTNSPSEASTNPAERAAENSECVHPPSGPIEISAARAVTSRSTSCIGGASLRSESKILHCARESE